RGNPAPPPRPCERGRAADARPRRRGLTRATRHCLSQLRTFPIFKQKHESGLALPPCDAESQSAGAGSRRMEEFGRSPQKCAAIGEDRTLSNDITKDAAYDAVAPDDFPAMMDVDRYGRRST